MTYHDQGVSYDTEAPMRVALRTLAITVLVEALLAVTFEAWLNGQPYSADAFLLGILVFVIAGLGITLAAATAIVGSVGAAQGRQFVWLAGLIGLGLMPIVGPFLARVVSPLLVTQPSANPECQGQIITAPCQATSVQLFFENLPLWVLLAAPALVGLFGLLYSFRMKT